MCEILPQGRERVRRISWLRRPKVSTKYDSQGRSNFLLSYEEHAPFEGFANVMTYYGRIPRGLSGFARGVLPK